MAHPASHLREYELIHYTPLSCNGMIPPTLPPCVEESSIERRQKLEHDKEERRKKQAELAKGKKKS